MKFGMHGMGSAVDAEQVADEGGLEGYTVYRSEPWRRQLVDALALMVVVVYRGIELVGDGGVGC